MSLSGNIRILGYTHYWPSMSNDTYFMGSSYWHHQPFTFKVTIVDEHIIQVRLKLILMPFTAIYVPTKIHERDE